MFGLIKQIQQLSRSILLDASVNMIYSREAMDHPIVYFREYHRSWNSMENAQNACHPNSML
jgi:hypothetical protein